MRKVPQDLNPKPSSSPYFVNAAVDCALIGGISLLAFILLLGWGGHRRSPEAGFLAAWLSWVFNWPHFSATLHRLYHDRSNAAQYPITAYVIPFLILGAVAAAFGSPAVVAPAFVKLFLLWSPYHFSGQTLGISLIYARRIGFHIGRGERMALSGFIYGIFLASVLRSESSLSPQRYYGIECPTLALPEWLPIAAETGMALYGILLLGFYARACVTKRRLFNPIVLLPALAQFLWFIPGNALPNYREFVPLFHSVQYLLIAWSVQMKERFDSGPGASPRAFLFRESLTWGIINFWGGVALFWMLPRVAQMAGYPLGFTEPVLVAAAQIHHFFVDGVIWKLRNPKVGTPLLVHVEDLLKPKPQSAAS